MLQFLLILFTVTPQIVPFDFGGEPVNSGDSASLTCSVNKGNLPLNFNWLHNNISISNIKGVTVMRMNKKISTLSIDSVEAEHAGWYTCVVQNIAGTAIHSAKLNVIGDLFYIILYSFCI